MKTRNDTDDDWFQEDKNTPVFTGLFNLDGTPILRRPVRVKMGFHMPDKKLTFDGQDFEEEDKDSGVVGWVYG